MKNILLIGRLNDMLKDINQYISGYFHVQLSADQIEVVTGMLKVVEPDLVIFSLIGMYDGHDAIFQKFQNEFPRTPVLTIGTQKEKDKFLKYYQSQQFENLIRPINNRRIYEAICTKLGMKPEEETREARQQEDERKKILVVDDNGPTLRTIKGMLEDQYQVSIAPSGMKAMTSIGKRRPDLILLDYEMPGESGPDVFRILRENKSTRKVPIVFLTGVDDMQKVQEVLKLKPQGYLLKPIDHDKLISTIEGLLDK